MSNNRRDFLRGAVTAASLLSAPAALGGTRGETGSTPVRRGATPGPTPSRHPSPFPDTAGSPPVATADVPKLPYELDGDTKVFHLVAEVVRRDFLPGRTFDVWGYNGTMPGPTIEAVEGDRLRLVVENRLPEPTSMHWHGLELPVEMDGVPGVTQDPIPPGGTFVYEFDITQNGTFFYHSHMAMQEMMGMLGLFVLHPAEPHDPPVDKDFGLLFQEWAILPNNSVPNSLSMEFNWLTINGRAGPHTTPLIVRLGDRVRIRMVNLGMDHHPIHLHGNTFFSTGTEAGRIPAAARVPENTVLLGVAQARDIEFEARHAGDWMLHCHLPHHMMNHMVSMVGPMTEMEGMAAGRGMTEGMGVMSGAALSDDNGPAMGRAIGVAREQATTHLVGGAASATTAAGGPLQHQHPGGAQAGAVPGYPQDMFMAMDAMVAKPETHGLRPTWSGGVMGMMTLVRVLPDELYEEVRRLQERAYGTLDHPVAVVPSHDAGPGGRR